MFNDDTDKEWEKFGKSDPYYGVLTNSRYRISNLSNELKDEFFKSGYDHINRILDKVRTHIDPKFSLNRALDFGCGVGRLVIPLSKLFETVTGMDVSESMLNEAHSNCDEQSVKNVRLVRSDDNLSLLSGKFDFIHSYIVFQHIPVERGERLFQKLLTKLDDGGVGVFHFTYAKELKLRKIIPYIKNYIPLSKNIMNLIKGDKFFAPDMQMNQYDLNKLLFHLQRNNINSFYAECTEHDKVFGIILFFQKAKDS
jgi:cyclopropane fatty-acyl-phospholipid synthase-like methyltransferase